MSGELIIAVCSAGPRPSVQNNHSKGSQWWSRDVYHISDGSKKTLCGRDTSDWLTIGPVKMNDDCCKRCAALLRASAAEGVGHE